MTLRAIVNERLERLVGYRLLRAEQTGAHLFTDLRRKLPTFRAKTVLDVGANIGQSAAEYLRAFPDAVVHSIEPARETFENLVLKFAGEPRFVGHRLALAARCGTAQLVTTGPSETFHLVSETPEASETVETLTLDMFLDRNSIAHVDFMKIDTEGHDMDVLHGGAASLAAGRVGVIQVEAGMGPDNLTHVPLETMKSHLEKLGYRLFGFYDQVSEFPTSSPHLRRTNPVFLSPATIALNRGVRA